MLQKGDATYTLSTKLALLVNIKDMHVPGEEVKFVASFTRFLGFLLTMSSFKVLFPVVNMSI